MRWGGGHPGDGVLPNEGVDADEPLGDRGDPLERSPDGLFGAERGGHTLERTEETFGSGRNSKTWVGACAFLCTSVRANDYVSTIVCG